MATTTTDSGQYGGAEEGEEVWAYALYSNEPQFEGELRFQEGDMIMILEDAETEDGWCYGVLEDGTEGHFPRNVVEVIPPDEDSYYWDEYGGYWGEEEEDAGEHNDQASKEEEERLKHTISAMSQLLQESRGSVYRPAEMLKRERTESVEHKKVKQEHQRDREHWTALLGEEDYDGLEEAFFIYAKQGLLPQDKVGLIMRGLGTYPSEKEVRRRIQHALNHHHKSSSQQLDYALYLSVVGNKLLEKRKGRKNAAAAMAASKEEPPPPPAKKEEGEYDGEEISTLLRAFVALDGEGKGVIKTEDLCAILMSEGEALSAEEMKLARKELDPHNTGFVDYKQFLFGAAGGVGGGLAALNGDGAAVQVVDSAVTVVSSARSPRQLVKSREISFYGKDGKKLEKKVRRRTKRGDRKRGKKQGDLKIERK
ncbi:Endophilin-A2 [Balamuthia mandrillaris]